eukprot:Colp12_sorted_trinity150504_noHs@8202
MTNMELIEAVPAQTTLWYFDGRGLAHMIRYMLAATNEPYVERFVKDKQTMDSLREAGLLVWNQIPLLQIDGLNLVQSMSIVRYLARKHKLYGQSEIEAVKCDMVADGIRDCLSSLVSIPFQPDREKALENARTVLTSKYLPRLELMLSESKSGWLVGSQMNYPDITLTEVTTTAEEYLPGILKQFPHVEKHSNKMREVLSAFWESPHNKPLPGDVYRREVDVNLGRA